MLERALLNIGDNAILLGKPLYKLCSLMNAFDRASRSGLQLAVDLVECRFCDLDRGVKQFAVDMDPAIIDRGVEHPLRLFFRDQAFYPVVQRALGGNVLLAV